MDEASTLKIGRHFDVEFTKYTYSHFTVNISNDEANDEAELNEKIWFVELLVIVFICSFQVLSYYILFNAR